jgi:hypothetical protein
MVSNRRKHSISFTGLCLNCMKTLLIYSSTKMILFPTSAAEWDSTWTAHCHSHGWDVDWRRLCGAPGPPCHWIWHHLILFCGVMWKAICLHHQCQHTFNAGEGLGRTEYWIDAYCITCGLNLSVHKICRNLEKFSVSLYLKYLHWFELPCIKKPENFLLYLVTPVVPLKENSVGCC